MSPRLHPIWNPQLKLPQKILEELSSGEDCILFCSYTDLQTWYESILNRHSLTYVEETERRNYLLRPELLWSIHSAVRCARDYPDLRVRDLLESSHVDAIQAIRYRLKADRTVLVDDQAVVQVLSSAFPRGPDDGIDQTGVFYVDVNREDCPRNPDWYDLTPVGRAAFYKLKSELDPRDRRSTRRLSQRVWEAYALPSPDTAEFFALWCAAHREVSIVTPKEDDWTELADLLPKPARFAPRGYQLFYSVSWQSRFDEALCDMLEGAFEQSVPIDSMNAFLIGIEGVRRSVLDNIAWEFNVRKRWSWDRLPILHAALFKRENRTVARRVRDRLDKLLKTNRIEELKQCVGRSVPAALAFIRRFYDCTHALVIPGRDAGKPPHTSKRAILPHLIEIQNLIRRLGIGRSTYWTVRIANSLANNEIYSETSFKDGPFLTADQALGRPEARRHGWLVHGERRLHRDLQLARSRSKGRLP